MKKFLLTGLIILLPIALTLMVMVYLFNLFTTPFLGIVEDIVHFYGKDAPLGILHNERLIVFISRIIVLLFMVFLIFILGICARKFFLKVFLKLSNSFFSRIPFIKSVYKLSKDVTKAMFDEGQKAFKETVLVPFPSGDAHALGFVTGDVPEALKRVLSETEVSVFVPTAPHPISGFLLLTPKKNLHPVDISTEETFRFLISCGTYHPKDGEEGKK